MRLVFINPNSTAAMTDSIAEAALAAVPGVEVLGLTNADGPPAIQGAEDGAAAVPGMLALLPEATRAGADAIVIACFDDTGLDLAREAAGCPVIGIGQAAYHMAALAGGRFGVVTTLPVSVPVLAANVAAYGFGPACTGIRPSGLGVLAVEAGSPATLDRLADEIAASRAEGAAAVVLGCAGMARHRDLLAKRTGVPLIDGVASAALLGRALARLRR